MSVQIAIVEDESEIAQLLKVYLENEGYSVCVFNDGISAYEYLKDHTVDLAIFDVMLPGIDGFELVRKIRENYYYPVIFLTARISDLDKIQGLAFGADDYITKPFNPLEIIARIKSLLRRVSRYNQPSSTIQQIIEIRGLQIDKDSHEVYLYDKSLELTPIEFSILWYLASHLGKVISSEELFEAVWQEKYFDNNNTVMAHIARLREKMNEEARKPKFIKTVWGVGYKIDE